ASHLETGLSQMRYDLVESAMLPRAPVYPNRPLLGLGAILLALGLGLGLGFALDRADPRIFAPSELATLGRPLELLACIPDLDATDVDGDGASPGDVRRYG